MYLKSKDVRLIICNIPNKETLLKTKEILLKKKIVTCINVINKITSFYIWKNKIKKKKEIKVIFKTFSFLTNKVIKIITKIHPYKIPEILTFKIHQINKKYFDWMIKTISK